jgi:hypothetical protein
MAHKQLTTELEPQHAITQLTPAMYDMSISIFDMHYAYGGVFVKKLHHQLKSRFSNAHI